VLDQVLDSGFPPSRWQNVWQGVGQDVQQPLRFVRRCRNWFAAWRSYADLAPDLHQRRQIRQRLQTRAAMNTQEWFQIFWQPLAVHRSVADFVYLHLSQYSGLEFARIYPSDRLNEDLSFTLVCWFNWEEHLLADISAQFAIDLTQHFEASDHRTVEEFVVALNLALMGAMD
jgi:hypothetical protein